MQLKTTQRMRTALAAVGVAALLVGGVNIASDAAGAAKPLLLGKSNKATKTTKLTAKKGPALSLKSKKGPALAVSTTDLITNLNADQVDGKGLDELEPQTLQFNLGTVGQAGGTPFFFQTTTLPAGNYEFNLHGLISLGTNDFAECAVIDLTRYLATSGTDLTSVFVISDQRQQFSSGIMDSHGTAAVVGGNRLLFLCSMPATSKFSTPIQFTIKKIDRLGAVPGVATTTVPKGVGRLSR